MAGRIDLQDIEDEKYLGKFVKDIPDEKLEELLQEGYSISPRTGRLRKKIKKRKKSGKIDKKKLNKRIQKIGWIVLLIIFLASLVMLFPQMGDKFNTNKRGYTK